jgi:hypothetical protein
MKIVMTILARNEDDILDENIRYHIGKGVNFFLLMDHHSDDETLKIMKKWEMKGYAKVWEQPSDEHYQAKWVSEMARIAFKEYKADWVINNDADEFWTTRSGDLKSTLSKIDPNVWRAHANRFDFFYRPFKGNFYDIMLFREINRRWTKCCHRGISDVKVDVGNHDVFSQQAKDNHMKAITCDEIEIFHFPIRDKERYKKKIIDGMNSLKKSKNIPEGTFFHWKQALEYINSGRFDEYLSAYTLTPHNVNPGIFNRIIMFDDKIQKFFNKI